MKRIFLFAILLFPMLGGCSLFNRNTASQPTAEEIAAADTMIVEPETLAKDSAQPRRRLPTLREQMQHIEDRQEAMQTDLQDIKNDLSLLKSEIVELRDVAAGKKKSVLETADVKGPAFADTTKKTKANDDILLPDDEGKAEQPKILPKKNLRKPASDQDADIPIPARSLTKDTPIPKAKSVPVKNDAQKSSAEASTQTTVKDGVLQPGEKPATPPSYSENYKAALQHVAKKEYEAAVPLLEAIIKTEKNPQSVSNAYYWLGESDYAQEKYEAAIQNFKEVLKTKSSTKTDDALLMMAECYRKMSNPTEARKQYEKLIQMYPQSEFVPRARKMLQVL